MAYIDKRSDVQHNPLKLIYGDCTLGVSGSTFHYIFSYQFGGPESLVVNGKEWLYRTPKPSFWRATTDNDRGNKFPLRSGMWLSADQFIDCIGIEVSVDDQEIELSKAPGNNHYSDQEYADKIKITFTYQTITVPQTHVEVAYEVNAQGEIKVMVHYFGKPELPELPVFGMCFILPTQATGYCYEGISGETYPDRMDGGVKGIYQVDGLPVTKYLVPQDCNVHMNTEWVEVYRNTTKNNCESVKEAYSLTFKKVDKAFAFSCIPYTSQELENATHQEELPLPRRTVLSILGAVRGVGGINSWGADVEEEYRIDGSKDITYSFLISPGSSLKSKLSTT